MLLSADAVEGIATIMRHTGGGKVNGVRIRNGVEKKAKNIANAIIAGTPTNQAAAELTDITFKRLKDLGERDVENLGEFIRDFTRHKESVKGGHHTLEYIESKYGLGAIKKFEVSTGIGKRKVDILLDIPGGEKWIEFKNIETTSISKEIEDQFKYALEALKNQGEQPEKLILVFRNKLSQGSIDRLNKKCIEVFNRSFPEANRIALGETTPFYRRQ